ncbi:MAG: hypothetical protein NTV56_22760 [Alphaproteobacteria bacterium]|nr:hypothetical protein [Alphaproteobacteria bacterium]
MTEANEDSSTSAAGHEPITLPDWLPPAVAKQARRIEAQSLSTDQRAILLRLATDPRMRGVWNELTRRDRRGGGYFHPAKRPIGMPALTREEAQAEALGELFHFAFCAARDRLEVSKPEDGAHLKAKLLENARVLQEIADDMAAINLAYPLAAADAAALRRVAGWHEDGAALLRTPSDPLTIHNDRGGRVVRGVQIIIAVWLRDAFGRPLHGTAATLAAVALDQKTSERVTRSAFSGQKKGRRSR